MSQVALVSTFTIRRATAADAEQVRTLLTANALPLEGLTPGLEHFLVAHDRDVIVGAIGLELYPPLALLRSAVVTETYRKTGLGSHLVQSIEDLARFAGIQRLILLTTTAERFFHNRGYRKIGRDVVSGPVTASPEFSSACPSTAVCMEKQLDSASAS